MTRVGEIMDPLAQPDTTNIPSPVERRRFARINLQSLQSNIGPVIDLSRGGMQVKSRRRLDGEQEVVLVTKTGRRLEVRARVAWIVRCGFRKYTVGIEFVDLSLTDTRELAKIASTHCLEL